MKLLLLTLLLITILAAFTLRKDKTLKLKDFNVQRVLPLRAILALLVILHHLAQQIASPHLKVIESFCAWGSIVVGVFFFVTGYGLMVSYLKKGENYLHNFIPNRLKKLLPAFLLATFAWLIAKSLYKGENAFLSFSELAEGTTPLPTSWFVYAILLFYLFFYITTKMTGKPFRIILSLWCLSTLYILTLHFLQWSGWWYNSIYALNIGVTYAYYETDIKRYLSIHPTAIVEGLIIIIFIIGALFGFDKFIHFNLRPYSFLLANNLVPLFVVLSIYILGIWQNKVLEFLGRISYEIYLVQGCFVYAFSSRKEQWVLYI